MNKELLELVWQRADRCCEYCHFPSEYAYLPFQIDHIIAEKHGGPTAAHNLAVSCYYCNSFNGANISGIDEQGDPDRAVQLYHPRRDVWSEHFYWDGPFLRGKTPIGRATVKTLRMNEPDAVEVRGMLMRLGTLE
jgi:hypothetical protein